MKAAWRSLFSWGWLTVNGTAQLAAPARDIPVLEDADVVIAGGSNAAVAAACAAADSPVSHISLARSWRCTTSHGNSVSGHFVRYAQTMLRNTQERKATP